MKFVQSKWDHERGGRGGERGKFLLANTAVCERVQMIFPIQSELYLIVWLCI